MGPAVLNLCKGMQGMHMHMTRLVVKNGHKKDMCYFDMASDKLKAY